MNLDLLRAYCLSFPQAKENMQWGADLCFKVGGKIFAIVSLDSVPQSLCFKCTPENFAELCELEGIRPAPYVGRYKWVLVEGLEVLDNDELEDLIRRSYEMVSAKIPRQRSRKTSNRTATNNAGRKRKMADAGKKIRRPRAI